MSMSDYDRNLILDAKKAVLEAARELEKATRAVKKARQYYCSLTDELDDKDYLPSNYKYVCTLLKKEDDNRSNSILAQHLLELSR